MKKYLISGFNTVQDVKLEVGTYTLVAYVKSMHGDVYTFALGDGTDWEEFSIDVIQGQLCKVWLTFTIDKKATKFKPIANNFTEELPVYVADLQLTRGNIPVESGASPFDIDQILNDLHDDIDAIEDFTEGAFLDGLLSREEKTQLRASLDAIGSIVESVKGSYDKLLDNPFIHENTMNSIAARYYAFIASWISDGDPRGLKPVILWIVNGDNIVSQNERDEKDRALNAFNDALYAYNQAEKEVYNDVGEAIDNIEIGGRNLIIGSYNDWRSRTVGQYGTQLDFIPIQDDWRGKTVTHSFEVKDIPEGESVRIRVDLNSPNGTLIALHYGNIVNLAGKSFISYTVPTDTQYASIRARVMPVGYTASYNVLFRCEKLEFGTKATDWTPAPEDTQAAIDKAQAIPYQAGEYQADTPYVRYPNSYPIVSYGTSGGVPLYYALKGDVGTNKQPNLPANKDIWESVPSFKQIFTEVLFAEFAKLDEFVFNGGKLFSQMGDRNGVANSPDYHLAGHKPYFEVDGISGRAKMKDAEITGTVNATSGLIGGMIIKDGNLISTIGKSYDGEEIVYGEYTKYQFNTTILATIPPSSHETWTDLPSTTTASTYIQYKKNTETQWTQVRVGISSGRWTVKYAETPNASVWYDTFASNRIWMQIEVGGDPKTRKAVKIDITSGYDFIPNLTIDGVTGRAKMKNAEIEGTITGSLFTSENGKVVVDGRSNQIYLKDEDSDGVRTILSPNKLPLTPSSYFGSSSTDNVLLGSLKRTYTQNSSSSVDLITIPSGDSSAYQITIPPITMSVDVNHPGGGGGIGEASLPNIAEMRVEIYKNGIHQYNVSSVSAMSLGELDNQTFTNEPKSYTIQGSGTWSVRVTHVHTINKPPSNSEGKVTNIGNAVVAKVVNSSTIGSNGMIIATSGTEYTYMVGDTYEVRRGNVGFRITNDGVQKSSKMNLSNPMWEDI